MQQERRAQRSPFAGDALGIWLKAVAKREGFDQVVLADDRGFVIADSKSGIRGEVLAAVAPLGLNSVRAMPEFHNTAVTIRPMRTHGMPVFLCALRHKHMQAGNEDLQQAEEGVVRILAS